MIVRSVHFGFDVPDTDASIATLYYPADEGSLDAARLTGLVAADRSRAPWPLIIMLPGINVTPDSYRWLAIRLVQAGYCVATYASIGSLGPAGRGITPGMDIAVKINRADGSSEETTVRCRIDTLDEVEYYKSGGILPYVLGNLHAA